MLDKIWRTAGPLLAYTFINIFMQTFFSMYYTYSNIVDSAGSVTMANELLKVENMRIMLYTNLVIIPVMIVLMKKDEDFYRFYTFEEHFKKINFSNFWILIPLGICMNLGITKLVTLFPIDNILGSYEEVVAGYEQGDRVIRILALCITGPIAEELVFRGLLYKRLKEYNEVTIAAYISAIIFGVAHFNLVQGLYAFFAGVIFVYVYEKYKTIFAPVLLHITANTIAFMTMEISLFDRINNILIAKIFFMIIEIVAIAWLLRLIWIKKKRKSDV